MLTSRTHAIFDLGLTAGLAAMAILSPRARWAAAAGAVAQAGTGALTNYEAGLVPLLSFRQHRRLDAVSAAVLGMAGLGLRSPALVAAGAATMGLALFSDGHAHPAPSMLYRPLDVPKPFAPDVWLIDSEIGPGVPVRMTVVRLPTGELLLHSPTRHSPDLQQALTALGPIRYLVAPNSVHWMFCKQWQDAVEDTVTYAAPGLRRRGAVRRAGLRVDHELSDVAPAAWGGAFAQVVVPGGAGFREVVLFHEPSRTVLLTDLVQNFDPGKLPWLLRPAARLLGNAMPTSRAPGHLRAVVLLQRGAASVAARRIVAWAPERIVVTHGRPIVNGAAERLRRSFGWLTNEV